MYTVYRIVNIQKDIGGKLIEGNECVPTLPEHGQVSNNIIYTYCKGKNTDVSYI